MGQPPAPFPLTKGGQGGCGKGDGKTAKRQEGKGAKNY
jgi:hypothetical protein